MSIDNDTVKKVAKLARIRVTDEECNHFAAEIGGILDWVEMLGEVDTDNVPALSSVSDVSLPWRKDDVNDGNRQEHVLSNAPEKDYGCFVVPKVIE